MQKEIVAASREEEHERALSKKFGRFQRIESGCFLLAVLSIFAGVALLLTRWCYPVGMLACFAVTAACVLLGSNVQKKKKALVQSEFSGFFRAELERFFGPEPEAPVLPVDAAFLQQAGLTQKQWHRSEISEFREGVWKGLPFSAANVTLLREYETDFAQEGRTKHEEKMFEGVVLRCAVQRRPAGPVSLLLRDAAPGGSASGAPEDFFARFTVQAAYRPDGQMLLAPEFQAVLQELERASKGRVEGVLWSGSVLSLALQTPYRFAEITPALDLRDIGGIRRWFTVTLQGMGTLLEILRKDAALFGAPEET